MPGLVIASTAWVTRFALPGSGSLIMSMSTLGKVPAQPLAADSPSVPARRQAVNALPVIGPPLGNEGSGVRVGVALVRVCFLKNAGLVIRQ